MEKMNSFETLISPRKKRISGKDVWRENLQYVIFAADKVRSTYGPKGAYKLVSYNRGPEQVVKITKDAISVLDELALQYPPATILSEAAKLQREEAGDGVTTFVIFLSALLKKADELLTMKIHANTIIDGYQLATKRALEILEQQATVSNQSTDIMDTVDCQRNLLTPQIRLMIKQAYSSSISDGRIEKENIRFLKKNGGSFQDSTLINGITIKKEKAHPNMPDQLRNLRIAITSSRLGTNRLEIKMAGQGPTHFQLNIKTPEQIREYKETEYRLNTQPLEKLGQHKVNLLLCEQPLNDFQKEKMCKMGIFALENVDKKDTLALSKATGAKIVGHLHELTEEDIGFADDLSNSKIELEKTVTISGCKGATFMLRGNTPQQIEELETAIKNSLTVLRLMDEDRRILPGGGAVETYLAEELKSYSKKFASREQLVVEAYCSALMDVPKALAENYGLDAINTVHELRKYQSSGFNSFGVGEDGCCDGVCQEPFKVKFSIIRRAYEVSMLLLRIDELLISKEIPKFHKQ